MSSIDHPQHYGGSENPYETIKVLEAWMTRDEMIGFCKGNALKYLSRHRQKGGLSDLEKSAWYNHYMVEYLLKADLKKPNRLDELAKLNRRSRQDSEEAGLGRAELERAAHRRRPRRLLSRAQRNPDPDFTGKPVELQVRVCN